MKWKFSKAITEGEPFFINGVNIWTKQWEDTGEKISIKDPIYNQDYSFEVYEISNEGSKLRFSAGEFSNNVWGIYEVENDENRLRSSIEATLLKIGLFLLCSSVVMFVFGASMFVSHGNYSRFTIKLSEFCFVFWFPCLIVGLVLLLTSAIFLAVKSDREKK
jgi:hypothetical protein